LIENGLFADVLLRLAALTGEMRYRRSAKSVLLLYAEGVRGAGPFAATYVRALRRYLMPELTVRIVGRPEETDEFRETALRLPSPLVSIRTLMPDDAEAFEMPPDRAAYVCVTGTCGAPVRAAAHLRAAYDALVE
jgi:uncharacterized protein YyaL (SSP411 family)